MTPLRERLTSQDMADLAAYLDFPAVPSPELRLSTSGPAASPYGGERLEFPEAHSGSSSPPTTIRLTNTGAKPMRLISAPALAGPDAAQFALKATDCVAGITLAAQQSCALEIVFNPEGGPGLHAAKINLAHDWIRGEVNIALIGRVVR